MPLASQFESNEQVAKMHSYQLLARVFGEQCIVKEYTVTKENKVIVKPNKDVSSSSVQNPSDPDAVMTATKGVAARSRSWSPALQNPRWPANPPLLTASKVTPPGLQMGYRCQKKSAL